MGRSLSGSAASGHDAFGTRDTLRFGSREPAIHRLDRIAPLDLPISLRIVLENLLRHQDGSPAYTAGIDALANWRPGRSAAPAVDLHPSRVFLHDTNGVPVLAGLAAMRDAMAELGGDPADVNPLIPADLVVDHSVIADVFGRSDARVRNVELEYRRNQERYRFLRWGQQSLRRFTVVPPGMGIMHQINIERLAQVVTDRDGWAFPDLCLGTDSHTTMVNGLGVLGWGIGGIEAEAALLGQSVAMPLPGVVGVRLHGALAAGVTATDLVLTITELLRDHGVVGKFVEFHGPGAARLTVADRATIANMCPEFGSTAAYFPIDEETLRYLRLTGRDAEHIALVEAYAKQQGLWSEPDRPPAFTEELELDLGTVQPSVAGPRRPQDRMPLNRVRGTVPQATEVSVTLNGTAHGLRPGTVAIAAITSCTNTSNPGVMVAAALLAKKAVQRGLTTRPWVKTTLSPGSRVVMDYYDAAGLTGYLEELGFHLAGFGCMTCIGASGPLVPEISRAVGQDGLTVAAVLSGNRNFEGRIQPEVKLNYLASPPLVVAYALAGTMDIDLSTEPLGTAPDGSPVHLHDLWPTPEEIDAIVDQVIEPAMYIRAYGTVFDGDERWRRLNVAASETYPWEEDSTYLRRPPYLDGLRPRPEPVGDITGARVLAKLGDHITTDHISPAGAVTPDSIAGERLRHLGVPPNELNTYASRRGNHTIMMRGAFANPRLRNQLVPDTEGPWTLDFLNDGAVTPIYDTAARYRAGAVPAIILAGHGYGAGSSRDWAAKGPALLGVRAVIAAGFERIHRSNLIGMGILPLQFRDGQTAETLGLHGQETYDINGLEPLNEGLIPDTITVTADDRAFEVTVRLDTPREADHYRHGGIMPFVLRGLLAERTATERAD